MTIVNADLGSPVYSIGILVGGEMMNLPLDCSTDLYQADVAGKIKDVFMGESLEYPEATFCIDRSVEFILPAKIQQEGKESSSKTVKVCIVQVRHLWHNGDYYTEHPVEFPNEITVGM